MASFVLSRGLTDQECPHNRVGPDPAPHSRGHEGRQAKGRLRGKQPKLNRKQEAHLVSLVHSGEYSTAEVAELFGVGRSTVYRAIERQRLAAKAGLAEASSRR
jgi:DNA invertase Pin-like site-specific DNA recombinase